MSAIAMLPACSAALLACDLPIASVSPREVGGKGWNLFRLRSLGFLVPRWLVIQSSVFDEAIAPIRPAIRQALEGIDPSDRAAAAAAARRIAEVIGDCEWPAARDTELGDAIDGALGGATLFSIRSSVVGEDSAEHSFAGLMDSVLNVGRADIAAAVRRVWASAFSERALLYRQRKRLGFADITTAVVVQEMVQADVSGVLFTRDPADFSRCCMISAGFGLGEGVVADAVETDTYRVGWNGTAIESELRSKDTRIVLDRYARKGTVTEPVPLDRRTGPALVESQIRELRDAGIEAERCFGAPQDIEWAFDASGRLFLLQARPIVRAGQAAASAGTRRFWDNSNIVESYPGLTLPLTFTFVQSAYEQTFRRAALGFLPFGGRSRPRPGVFRNLLGLLDGRVYYNLGSWYEMFSYLPAPDRHQEAWDRMIGIAEKTRVTHTAVGRLTRLASLLAAVSILLRTRAIAHDFFARFESFYSLYRGAGAAEATAEELAATFRSVEEAAAGFWHLTIYNDFCAIRYHEWLTGLCARWKLDAAGLQNALLAGEKGIESVAPVRSLVRIAERVHQDPAWRELFEGSDDKAIWDAIQNRVQHRTLRDAFLAHLDAFGDRGIEELKLEAPTFREQPERLVTLAKRYGRLGLTVAVLASQERNAAVSVEAALHEHPLHFAARKILGFVLAHARLAIQTRENMRFARSRLFGIVRRLFRRLGERFAEGGLLESPADIWLLTKDEVLGFVDGTAVTQDLKALVRLRKAEYERFARLDTAERLETLGIPYLETLHQERKAEHGEQVLRGTGCSAGRGTGRANVVTDPKAAVSDRDQVLVARSTDPGWVFLMIASAGIVVEKGSLLSHTAIIGRELGIPTVVGAKGATRLIPDGAAITLDGTTGEVRWN